MGMVEVDGLKGIVVLLGSAFKLLLDIFVGTIHKAMPIIIG